MIRVDEVRRRIEDLVPELDRRLRPATEFAQMVQRDELPQVTPAGFVLLGGLQGGAATLGTGLFRQGFQERIIVVLVIRTASDPTGEAALDEATPIVRKVIVAVAGWGPEEAPGVFVLEQAETVGAKDGALVFQIDFALHDQLRIVP